MKQLALIACLAVTPLPALAQDDPSETPDDGGFSLMEEGARLFFRGLLDEMEPAMDDMQTFAEDMRPALRRFVDDMGPALTQLMSLVDQVDNYTAPEVLPNGDIIIRRKDDAPPYVAPPGRETDL